MNIGMLTEHYSAFSAIAAERQRQDKQFGVDNDMNDDRWFIVVAEEIGELARELRENGSVERRTEEIIQVAATCVAWLEAYEQRACK